MADLFKYKGQEWSSNLLTITVDGKEMNRELFRRKLIKDAADKLPAIPEGESASYVATGGGYGSNDKLLAYENKGTPSIKGDLFRDHSAFEAEKAEIRKAIEAHLGEKAIAENPKIVEQTLRSFYSDEVNTRIAKEVVKESIRNGKSIAYESASIYPDTIERVMLAGKNNAKTVLVAGDMDLDTALTKQASATNKFNTAASYKLFSARFTDELVPLFDEIRLYNTDGPEPVLIAEKKGKGQKLEILDEEKYKAFLAKKDIDLEPYTKDPAFKANTTSLESWAIIKEKFKLADMPAVEAPTTPGSKSKPQQR